MKREKLAIWKLSQPHGEHPVFLHSLQAGRLGKGRMLGGYTCWGAPHSRELEEETVAKIEHAAREAGYRIYSVKTGKWT